MSEETGTEVADSGAAVTQRFRRFKDDLRRERASEGATPDDGPNPLDQPDARVDWSDLPDGILHRVFQMLYREKGGRELVGVCGQVCRGWHDDALDVLMQDTAATRRPVPGVAPDGGDDDDDETERGETGAGGRRRGGGGRRTRGEGEEEEDTSAAAKRETSDVSSVDDDEVGSKRRRLPDESEAASAGADDDGGGFAGGGGGGGEGGGGGGGGVAGWAPVNAVTPPTTTHHRAGAFGPPGAPAEQAGSGAQDSAHCQRSDGSVRP